MRCIVVLLGFIVSAVNAEEMMRRQDQIVPPSAGEALLVFVAPGDTLEFTRMSIVDVTSDPRYKFVGFVEPGAKVLYRVPAGRYLFMLNYAQASFLDAEVAAGKTYYVLVSKDNPRRATVMNRYVLRPMREPELSDIDFARLERNATPIAKTRVADDWFIARQQSFADKKSKFLPNWPERPANHTLQQSDGR